MCRADAGVTGCRVVEHPRNRATQLKQCTLNRGRIAQRVFVAAGTRASLMATPRPKTWGPGSNLRASLRSRRSRPKTPAPHAAARPG